MAVKVVAFDVYDTLARWPDDHVAPIEVQRLLARFGVEISYQAYEAARHYVLFFDSVARRIEGWTDFLALVFGRMNTPISVDLLTSLTAVYERRARMTPFDDALPAIEAAGKAGLRTCAFTTLPEFMFRHGGSRILSALDHYFDGAAIGLPKGHPRFYRRITETLGVAPPDILCVGDDPICDIELPADAGWRTVHLVRSGRPPGSGERTIASLSDVTRYFNDA